MSEQMLKRLEVLLDELDVIDGMCRWPEVANILPRMRGEFQSSAVSETLGWRWRRKNDVGGFGEWHVTADRPKGEAYDVTPLGAQPQSAQEAWALLYLHDWDPPKEGQEHRWEPGKNIFPDIHAIYDTWQEAETIRAKMVNPSKYWVKRVHGRWVDGLSRATERSQAVSVDATISIDLMQRVWANLYFDEAEAGGTFQHTLNEVVDWLTARNALPSALTRPLRPDEPAISSHHCQKQGE